MSPTKIMFIRHAEKPVPDGAAGIAADGSADPKSLSQTGWDRADRLVDFFSRPSARSIERPDAIFAASSLVGSKRPAETVTPLANALWTPPERARRFIESISKEDVAGLAAAVMAAGGVVLVSWEHLVLPEAVAALPDAPATPAKWPGDRFDVVWVLTPKPGGWGFEQTPQMLMPDDQDSVIPFSHHQAE
jgi:hypothetical protein